MIIDLVALGERVRRYRIRHNLTQTELGARIGRAASYISNLERGQAGTPSAQTIVKLARALGVGVDDLIGKPVRDDGDKVEFVPVIAEVMAGKPRITDEDIIGYEPMPSQLLKGGEHFCVRVGGESMIGAGISPGDLVLVQRTDFAEDGKIVLVDVENEGATIKRLRRSGHYVILESANPQYPPLVFEPDRVRIIGVIKRIIKDVR